MDKVLIPQQCWICFSIENNRTETPASWANVLNNCRSYLDISITIKSFENDIPWSCCNYCYDSSHQLTLLEEQVEKLQKEISDLRLLFSKNVVQRRNKFRKENGQSRNLLTHVNEDPAFSFFVDEIIVKEEVLELATNAQDQQLTTTTNADWISCSQMPCIQLERVPNCGNSTTFVAENTAFNIQPGFEASDEYIKTENNYIVNENYTDEVKFSPESVQLSNSQEDVPNTEFVFEQIPSVNKTLKCETDDTEDIDEHDKCDDRGQNLKITHDSPSSEKIQKKISSFPCSFCGKSLPTRAKLEIHERSHTGEKPFVCSICTKSFGCAGHLRRHKLIHSSKKPHKCSLCKKAFKCTEAMKKHEKTHSGHKPHKCSVCEKSFTRLSYLRDHKKIHSGDLPFKCSVCEKAFAKEDYLKKHEIIHSVDLQFKCSWCEKSFTRLNYLKDHEKYHTGERPFKCSQCDKSFVRSDYLKNHEKYHSKVPGDLPDLPFKCSSCEKSFANMTNLKVHKLLHTGVRPYKCTQCDKSYTLKNNLNWHVRLQHAPTEVAFNCSHCSKSFKSNSDVKRHELIHSGEKPYKCPHCEKYFTRKQDVGIHCRRLHKEKKEEFILP